MPKFLYFIEKDSEILAQNGEVKSEVETLVRKCELDLKLFNNELEGYSKIEGKKNKEATKIAFSKLEQKFIGFKRGVLEVLGIFLGVFMV